MKTAGSPNPIPARTSQVLRLWSPFVLATFLTLFVDRFGWRLSSQLELLTLFGVLSLAFGIRVIWRTRGRWYAVVLVVLGLIIGQLWFIEMAVVLLGWSIGGFAP